MPQDQGSVEAERRLWFDFLCRVNDRNLDRANKSGASGWVLIGLASALVYRNVPLIPWFLSITGYLASAMLILLLEINVVLTLLVMFVSVLMYCEPQARRRVVPEGVRRLRLVVDWSSKPTLIIVGGVGIWEGLRNAIPGFVSVMLVLFGIFWVINALYGIVTGIRTYRKAKVSKAQLPVFHGFNLGTDSGPLLLCGVFFPFAFLAASALFAYLRFLSHLPTGWVVPLGAASQFLATFVIVATLLTRELAAAQSNAYLALEREVVIENLEPLEIKTRFVTQLFGHEIGEWLRSITADVLKANEELDRAEADSQNELTEIEKVSAEYQIERKGRAEKLKRRLEAAVEAHQSTMEKALLQLEEYSRLLLSNDEAEMLKNVIPRLRESTDRLKRHLVTRKSLEQKLAGLIDR